ncbi:hypothetical protein Phi19:1_gp064 [Cellulophaga phage phi19:1]|uniref:Uncharacterized protein n=1 Tax=Cellulophaga phage phi19:1 TaxID=1327970 RepID=R9ZVY2_9CAUD|nr:hypothetical protein Phi19:1_gp064 [Cellulophaga phage phi19:1]AGO47354.1 hypothetical protein Phi19:1_gp064 [Cellulophaga phage phi19:1]
MEEHDKDKLYIKIIEDYHLNKKFVDDVRKEVHDTIMHFEEKDVYFNHFKYAIDIHNEKGNEDFTISFIQQLFKYIREGKIKIE